MLFGKRFVEHDCTTNEEKVCAECSSSASCRFSTEYIVVFGFDLIPLQTRMVCDACGHTSTPDAPDETVQLCADKHRTLKKAAFLKTAAILVVLAVVAVMVIVMTAVPAASPEQLKALIDEDGIYSIQNHEGEVLGIVQALGEIKQLTFYEDKSVLVGEPGADGTFIKHTYQTEALGSDATSILITNTGRPGILKDRHGMVVREYHYNAQSGKMGYLRGVEDLSAIAYTRGKAVYPFTYYSESHDESLHFTVVLHISNDQRLEATFADEPDGARFLSLTVTDYEGGREATETIYYFDADAMDLAKQSDISPESSPEDIRGFIEQLAPTPSIVAAYTYFQNSHVFSSIDISMPDNTGNMQSYAQEFDVTQKGRFYLQRAKS